MTKYHVGGLLRCCIAAVPDRDGTEHGEHIPCPYEADKVHSGVCWNASTKCWEAAWIQRGQSEQEQPK